MSCCQQGDWVLVPGQQALLIRGHVDLKEQAHAPINWYMGNASLENDESVNDYQAGASVALGDFYHVNANGNWLRTAQNPHCQTK